MRLSGRVAILLATYNGEQYLDELLRSIMSQTYPDFVVMVRDDKSSDRTPEILARWLAAEPTRFVVIDDDRGNLRSCANFSRLMELCETPYFAFCDQDDVWLPKKLEICLAQIQALEARFGQAKPILVYSDLKLVDGDLREIASSYFRYVDVIPERSQELHRIIINNIVQGCASVGNRALLLAARPVPHGAPYHDWWVALVAASCGVLQTIREPTVLWRQHGANQVGAGRQRAGTPLWQARHVLQQPKLLWTRMANASRFTQAQAVLLLETVGPRMCRRNLDFLRAFCLPSQWRQWAILPLFKRMRLFVRFSRVYARAFFMFLPWCC
jgi:hypothetical protein